MYIPLTDRVRGPYGKLPTEFFPLRFYPSIYGPSAKPLTYSTDRENEVSKIFIAAAASEPEANERGSSVISRRLHYRGLQSLFLTKRKELWLCANGRFTLRSGMRKELWLCANERIRMRSGMSQGIVVARMGRFRMRSISKSLLTKDHEIRSGSRLVIKTIKLLSILPSFAQ